MEETFEDRLNSLFASHGIKNYRLAKILGVAESTIRSWRKGRIPRMKHISALCEYFKVSDVWLLFGDKNFKPNLSNKAASLVQRLEKYPDVFDQVFTISEALIERYKGKGDTYKSSPLQKKRQRSA